MLLAALLGFAMLTPVLTKAKDNALPQVQQIEARGGNGAPGGGGDRFGLGNRDRRGGMREPVRCPQRGPQMPICPQPMGRDSVQYQYFLLPRCQHPSCSLAPALSFASANG